jgi:predicted transcriptional regulator
MWHRVDVVLTDVSEERIASIFRVEGKIRKFASEETVRTGASRLLSS